MVPPLYASLSTKLHILQWRKDRSLVPVLRKIEFAFQAIVKPKVTDGALSVFKCNKIIEIPHALPYSKATWQQNLFRLVALPTAHIPEGNYYECHDQLSRPEEE